MAFTDALFPGTKGYPSTRATIQCRGTILHGHRMAVWLDAPICFAAPLVGIGAGNRRVSWQRNAPAVDRTEFSPSQDEGQFNVQVETPLGSSIDRTSRILEEVERRLWELPHVRTCTQPLEPARKVA